MEALVNSTRGLTLATQWSGLKSYGRDVGTFQSSGCARPQATGVYRVVRMTLAVDEEAPVITTEEQISTKPAKFSKVNGFCLLLGLSKSQFAWRVYCSSPCIGPGMLRCSEFHLLTIIGNLGIPTRILCFFTFEIDSN
jgi:hypothetical protein